MRSGWTRFAQAQRDVRFTHSEVEVVVRQQQLQFDFRVEFDELAETGGEPIGAEPKGRRHPEFAVRLFPAVDEPAAHGVELQNDVAHRSQQHFALLGQNEAASMAMKQRRAEVGLERPNLTADRRLAEAQGLACVRERSRVRGGLKNAQLIPIHRRFPWPRPAH